MPISVLTNPKSDFRISNILIDDPNMDDEI